MKTPQRPNIALYIVVAIVIIILGTYGIIGFVTSRGGDEGTVIAGLLAWAAPTVAGLIAMLVAVKNQDATADIQKQVNGTLSKFADQAVEAETEVEVLKRHVTALEKQLIPPAASPYRNLDTEIAKGPPE